MKRVFALIAALYLGGVLQAADSPAPAVKQIEVAPVPTAGWEVLAAPGDEIALDQTGGSLAAKFRLNIGKTFLVGHVTYWRGCADLLLKQPLTIPAGSSLERVRFEAAGLTCGSEKAHTKVMLLPILRDRDGELFYYTPAPAGHLLAGSSGWSQWQTPSFYAGEAGAATQDIYYAEGKLTNNWPDGELTFLGLRVEVREPVNAARKLENGAERSGVLRLSALSVCPLALPYADPFLFADSLLQKKGGYRFSAQIGNEFQGVPIREFTAAVNFDPEDPQSARQKLAFPLGPDDNYWIKYLITDENNAVIKGGELRWQTLGSTQTELPPAVSAASVPAVGCMRINYGHPGRGVYERGAPLAVSVRVFPKTAAAPELAWQLRPCLHADVLASGKEQASASGQPFRDLTLNLPAPEGRSAYRLLLTLRDGEKILDQQTYLLGYQTDLAQRHDRAGDRTDRKKIHAHAYFRTTYLPPNHDGGKELTEAQEVANFRDYCANAGRMGNALTHMIDLKDFEVLPGVFDFAILDRLFDAAADSGCKLNIRLAHADASGKNFYNWPKYHRQISYDGAEATGHGYYGAYSVTDPRVTKLWLDSYRALYSRYQQHTAFEGYYVMQPGGEWTVVDQPWAGVCTGYDPAAAASFRVWLREDQKLSLDALNQRWGSAYQKWEELLPPQPDFRAGSTPDLRMAWVDFCRFKQSLGTDIWFPLAVKSIRSYDQRNLITVYTAPSNARKLYGLLDFAHNGGNHYGENLGEFVKDWEQGGIGWITEPHHPHRWAAYGDPAQKGWVLDWSVWVMLAQAAGGGANLHVYYIANPTLALAKHYGGAFAYDRMELFRPILEEMLTLKLEEPARQVATFTDELTLFCKHRTTFSARLADLRRWFELLKTDSVFYENYDPDHARQYKLFVPNILDEVMSAQNLRAIEQGVKNGAKAVISANTGKYAPELGSEPFALLRALGVAPPPGEYRLTGTGAAVSAAITAAPGAPAIFTGGDKLAFFTLARLGEDLKTDEVKRGFWQYPYRWIPQTNYFGYYPGAAAEGGVVLARFADGGAAVSLHKHGKGEVLVFWGTPDMSGGRLKGFMARTAEWAGVANPRAGSPIPHTLEGRSDFLNRRYALLYQETPGAYQQKLLSIPDGKYFLDDAVSSQRYGVYEGKELREQGLPVEFIAGYSPLKIIRLFPLAQIQADWSSKYRQPAAAK